MDGWPPVSYTHLDVYKRQLQGIVIEKLAEIAQYKARSLADSHDIKFKGAMIEALTAEIKRLRRMQFSARTEKMDPGLSLIHI